MQPKLIIHGGAGLHGKGNIDEVRQSLYAVIEELYPMLLLGTDAEAVVVRGCQLLEDNPRFNAGTGSVLQSDGQVRMSASLMSGAAQRFSGVINVSRVKNPIELAKFLQGSDDRVLSDFGATELARELNIPSFDPLTKARIKEWMEEREHNFSRAMADVMANPEAGRGTIGVVALDSQRRLATGTSTGGKGFERVGRVSDSCTPAGNYAATEAAVSCTGIGEDILDECFAARIVVRVTDGMAIKDAFAKSFDEASDRKRDFGAIGIGMDGTIAWGKTSEMLISACHDGENVNDTLEADVGVQVGAF